MLQPSQKSFQVNDILLKQFNENVSIENENCCEKSEKTEDTQIVISTKSDSTTQDGKKDFGPTLDLVFWRKYVESEDPSWRFFFNFWQLFPI